MRIPRPAALLLFVISLPMSLTAQTRPQLARDYVYGPAGRLTATIEPDLYAPDMPPFASASGGPCSYNGVTVQWGAAQDIGSGVVYYNVYRNGGYLSGVFGLSYFDSGNFPGPGWYSYSVSAVDAARNEGMQALAGSVWIDFCIAGLSRHRPLLAKAKGLGIDLLGEPKELRERVLQRLRNGLQFLPLGFLGSAEASRQVSLAPRVGGGE